MASKPASIDNLAPIHQHYESVLEYTTANPNVPLRVALQQLGIGRQTLRDSLAITELKIVESIKYRNLLGRVIAVRQNGQVLKLKDFETLCRRKLQKFSSTVQICRETGQLLHTSSSFY